LFDRLAEKRVVDGGVIHGPFGMMLHSPVAAALAAELSAYYRYQSPLPERARHLLALVVARQLDCQYEFAVHADLGREAGLPVAAIEAVRDRREPEGLAGLEAAVYAFVHQLVADHRVGDEAFDRLVDQVGLPAVTDIVGNVGWLMFISCPLNGFNVEVRPEHKVHLPEPQPEA
jgi:4-carboxymuconolactone decarboxylase